DAGVQIAAPALELRVRRQADAQIEVAGRTAARSVLSLARDADTRAVADARRDADVHRPRVPVVLQRESPHRALIGLLERQRDLLFEVAPLARACPAGPRA